MARKTDPTTQLNLVVACSIAFLANPFAAGAQETAQPREPLLEGTGPHTRVVSTDSPDARRYFNQGLNLLFAFNHDEAARSFRQAAEFDPDCAMAWWGVAISQGPHINRPIVDPDQAKTAMEALARATAPTARASDLERAFIAALATRCTPIPPEDRSPLDRAYADAMHGLRDAHPDDADLGALTAEASMNLRPWDLYSQQGEPRPGTVEIVSLIEEVLRLNPDHPLANHLLIHAVEASAHPERAEGAADRLRDLQPGLSHNVHMPSHIDVRLGHWEKAKESNRKAIAADRRFLALRPDPGFYGLYIAHNYHMLAYAAMMRGERKVAVEAIDEMTARVPIQWACANAAIADGFLAMPLEVRMRFGLWDEVLAAPEPEPIFPIARALRRYARAIALAAQEQVARAIEEQNRFREAAAQVPDAARFGNNKASDLLAVAGHLLEAEILYRQKCEDEAFVEFRAAAGREDLLRYSEPPDWIQPVRHAFGAALSLSGRFEEAAQVYRDDLKRLPENGWSLFGLTRALERLGRTDEAASVRARWDEAWKDADLALTSSCLCLAATSAGPTRHTTDGLDKVRPVWAADGRSLLFARALPDTSSYLQIVVDTQSPEAPERRLTDRKGTEYHGAISPDGSRVLLTVIPVVSMQGDCDLAAVPFSGGAPETFLGYKDAKHSHQEWPSWSPGGDRFVFASTHEGNQEIYTAKPDGTDVVRLTQGPGVDTHPAYTPDGARVVFATDRFGGLEIASMKTDGTDLVRLTESPGVDDYPSVSPDGRRIAFASHRDGQFEVYLMNADGTDPTNLSDSPGRDTMPTWTPDGRGVTFVSDRDGTIDLYTIAVP